MSAGFVSPHEWRRAEILTDCVDYHRLIAMLGLLLLIWTFVPRRRDLLK